VIIDNGNNTLRNVRGIEITGESTNPRFAVNQRKTHQINDNSVLIEMLLQQTLGASVRYIHTLTLEAS